jgi:hypothetical protein
VNSYLKHEKIDEKLPEKPDKKMQKLESKNQSLMELSKE